MMYLFSLVVLFVLVGWVLATTRFSRKVDGIVDRVSTSVNNLGEKVSSRGRAIFAFSARQDEFRRWALYNGIRLFPEEFITWLAGLSEAEAAQFHRSLSEFSDSLGYRLSDLMDGSLDHDPVMRQVFVEAIVVYSPAYRRARQAKKKAAAEIDRKNGNGTDPEKKPAEKSASRRKQPVAEHSETAAAG